METLRYVVLANGLLLVVSVAYYGLLRRETFFGANRLALWLGVVAALGLPLLTLPDWRPQPVKNVMYRTAQVIVPRVLPTPPPADVTITMPNGKTYPAFSRQLPAPVGWSWQQLLIVLYGLVALALLIRLMMQLLSLRRLINQSEHELYSDFVLVPNPTVASPFSFFKWVVLNPDNHAPDELEQILRHERVHVRAWHSADMLGAEVLGIFFWFNPAVYLFRHLLHQTLEFAADRAVLNEGIDARSYQYNLVKVSLAGGGAGLTNHFSRSQLKPRIAMINQPNSPRTAWLKYAVLVLTAISVATAFARHQVPLPRLVAKPTDHPASTPKSVIEKLAVAEPVSHPTQVTVKARIAPVESPRQDSARKSPSRYMLYEGNYLYWIVTPKITFDDFAVMKKEFEKHGRTLQLNELKYDPLYACLNRISFTVKRPWGGIENWKEINDDTRPIPSIGGYVGIGPKVNYSSMSGLRNYKADFPESLRTLAAEEEKEADQFITTNKPDYLILEGEQKFKSYGTGGPSYAKGYIQENPTQNNSGLIVNTDGSLSVNEELGNIRVFVNNESISRAALSKINIDQFYTVVQKMQYNPARKESFIAALLIYTTDAN